MSKQDETLINIFQREWEYDFENSPEYATFMGNHKFDDRLGEMTIEEIDRDIDHKKKVVQELKQIDKNELSEENKLNLELYIHKLKNVIDSVPFKEYLMPLNQMHGLQNFFPRLIQMMPFKKEKDYQNYLSRLNQVPRYIDQTIELMDQGIRENITNPKICMIDVPEQINRIFEKDYKETSFFEPLKKEGLSISDNLKNDIENAIKDKLFPAFLKLRDYIKQTYIPACRETIAFKDLHKVYRYLSCL